MQGLARRVIDRLQDLAGDVLFSGVARGDILYRGASKWQNLGAGTAGKVLQTNGAGADPTWVTPSGGGIADVATKTGNYTLTFADGMILGDCSGGAFTLTLPTAVGHKSASFYIKKLDNSANALTVATTSSQTVDGATTRLILVQYECLQFVSDGTNWQIA